MRPVSNYPIDAARRRQLLKLVAGWLGITALAACGRSANRPGKGDVFPDFVLRDLDGADHDSRAYQGKPLLINFWATWCPPCRKEMADLEALDHQLSGKGLKLLAISVDTDQNLVREFLARERLGFTVLMDPAQQWSASALRVPGFPTTYLIGADSRIREVWVGARAWTEPAIQSQISARAGLM